MDKNLELVMHNARKKVENCEESLLKIDDFHNKKKVWIGLGIPGKTEDNNLDGLDLSPEDSNAILEIARRSLMLAREEAVWEYNKAKREIPDLT